MNGKRKRILPIHTKTVEQRIKETISQLDYTKAEMKWFAIVNEVKSLNLQIA